MIVLISQQHQGLMQKQAPKVLVECLIIGKQYDLSVVAALRKAVELHPKDIDGAVSILDLFLICNFTSCHTP
jgi:hypothetical protein